MAQIGKGQMEMLKQIEIKVSLRKKSGMHQPIRWLHCKKILNLQNLNYCQCFEVEVKLSNIVDQHDF